jgi:hypothetical protein
MVMNHGRRKSPFIRSTSRSRDRSTRPDSKGTRLRLVVSRRSSSEPRHAGSGPAGELPAVARAEGARQTSAPAYDVPLRGARHARRAPRRSRSDPVGVERRLAVLRRPMTPSLWRGGRTFASSETDRILFAGISWIDAIMHRSEGWVRKRREATLGVARTADVSGMCPRVPQADNSKVLICSYFMQAL